MLRYWPFVLNVLVMVSAPWLLAHAIRRRRRASWSLFGMGAVTFVLSQVGHIPFNWLVLERFALVPSDVTTAANLGRLALFLGLSAGLFEETARALTLRYWARDARSWGRGLMLGAGHGGSEAILLGALVAINLGALAAIDQGLLLRLVPPGDMPLVQRQIEATFGTPWYLVLLGGFERLAALCVHLALTLLVMQGFVRRQRRWYLAAVGWHALVDAAAVVMLIRWGAVLTEVGVGLMAAISLGAVFWLRAPEPVPVAPAPLPPPVSLAPDRTPPPSREALERSRYE